MKLRLIAFLIIIFSAYDVYPCFCLEQELRSEYRSADEVFAGEVIDVQLDETYKPEPTPTVDFDIVVLETHRRFIVRFKILEDFKSSFRSEITLYSYVGSLCSRTEFKQGEKYVVFASRTKEGLAARGSCSRTGILDKASQDYKLLRNLWFWEL